MEYRISVFEPPTRVVLVGSGSGVSAVDEIRLERIATGTRLDYTADIRLGGVLRLIQPFLGCDVRDHRAERGPTGMQRTLDAQAAAGGRDAITVATTGGRGMKVAIVGAGVSGLTAAYALRHDHEIRLFDGDADGRRARQDRRQSRPTVGQSRSTRDSSSTTSTPTRASPGCSPSSASQTQASDMSLGSDLPGLWRGVQLARRPRLPGHVPHPSSAPTHWRMMADILRFYREARATLDATDGRRPRPSARLPR